MSDEKNERWAKCHYQWCSMRGIDQPYRWHRCQKCEGPLQLNDNNGAPAGWGGGEGFVLEDHLGW